MYFLQQLSGGKWQPDTGSSHLGKQLEASTTANLDVSSSNFKRGSCDRIASGEKGNFLPFEESGLISISPFKDSDLQTIEMSASHFNNNQKKLAFIESIRQKVNQECPVLIGSRKISNLVPQKMILVDTVRRTQYEILCQLQDEQLLGTVRLLVRSLNHPENRPAVVQLHLGRSLATEKSSLRGPIPELQHPQLFPLSYSDSGALLIKQGGGQFEMVVDSLKMTALPYDEQVLSVNEWLETYGPIGENLSRAFLKSLLLPLSYLHSKKIAHNNVSSRTVFVRPASSATELPLLAFLNQDRFCYQQTGLISEMTKVLGEAVEPEDMSTLCTFLKANPLDQFVLQDLQTLGELMIQLVAGTHPFKLRLNTLGDKVEIDSSDSLYKTLVLRGDVGTYWKKIDSCGRLSSEFKEMITALLLSGVEAGDYLNNQQLKGFKSLEDVVNCKWMAVQACSEGELKKELSRLMKH